MSGIFSLLSTYEESVVFDHTLPPIFDLYAEEERSECDIDFSMDFSLPAGENRFQFVSASAPMVNPSNCPWGQKTFTNYLGENKADWEEYDATYLLSKFHDLSAAILIDQVEDDKFLHDQLMPNKSEEACRKVNAPLLIRLQPRYDHSYFFIASRGVINITIKYRFPIPRLGDMLDELHGFVFDPGELNSGTKCCYSGANFGLFSELKRHEGGFVYACARREVGRSAQGHMEIKRTDQVAA